MNSSPLRTIIELLARKFGEDTIILGETTAECIEKLGRIHRPTECSCHICKTMCNRSPCLGTPQDILRLAEAGYASLLVPTWYEGLCEFGIPGIPMVQLGGIDMKENGHSTCPLWDKGTGLCTVHARGLKPIDGRFADCATAHPVFTSSTWVASLTWLLPANFGIVAHLFRMLGVLPHAPREKEIIRLGLTGETRPATEGGE